jgi:hypothetical protein
MRNGPSGPRPHRAASAPLTAPRSDVLCPNRKYLPATDGHPPQPAGDPTPAMLRRAGMVSIQAAKTREAGHQSQDKSAPDCGQRALQPTLWSAPDYRALPATGSDW